MADKRIKNKIYFCVILAVLLFAGIFSVSLLKQPVTLVATGEYDTHYGFTVRNVWERHNEITGYKAINPEFIGVLKVGNLIEQNMVQAKDNDKYLTLTWDEKEDSSGAAFLDYRNKLEDQNLIIYGHYVYRDETRMFSPLHLLKEAEKYEDNKMITLEMPQETRTYEIASVYYYEMGSKNLLYYKTKYGASLEAYSQAIRRKQFYDTGIEIKKGDSLLTLQTCVRNRDELRLIVVAREVKK